MTRRTKWDEYRVTLFKKKIREALPLMRGIRFRRSKGRCNLILDVKWRYYSNAEEVMDYVLTGLKSSGIEGEAKDMFDWHPERRPLDYVTIPIDQAALPERKRA